jgi:CrcB protein
MRSFLAVAVGGMLGCLARWLLAIVMNRLFPAIPPGTLAANYIGCYIIGVAVGIFAFSPTIAPEWRLFVATGFCGGLTTFSTFSVEIVALLNAGRTAMAAWAVALHLFGSLGMTIAGIYTANFFKS